MVVIFVLPKGKKFYSKNNDLKNIEPPIFEY